MHEDLERLERVIVKDYQQEAKTHRDKLAQNHRVRKRIDDMQGIAAKLVSSAECVWGTHREQEAEMRERGLMQGCCTATKKCWMEQGAKGSRYVIGWNFCITPSYQHTQVKVYDDDTEEARHRKEEIAALGADNPTAVYA